VATETITLSVGAKIWFDGATWTVVEVFGSMVRLRSHTDQRLAEIIDLLRDASPAETPRPDLDDVRSELSATALANLSKRERERIQHQYEVLAPLLDEPHAASRRSTPRLQSPWA
jgi:hypothetical protein